MSTMEMLDHSLYSVPENLTFTDKDDSTTTIPNREYSDLVKVFAMVLGIPIITCGSLGNLFTIIAVVKMPQLRSTSNAFVISLAVSDLTCCCITIPTLMTVYRNSEWPFGDLYCCFFSIFVLSNLGAALLSLSATAFGRYLKIIHPGLFCKLLGRKWKVCLVITVCWIAPFAFLLPPMLGIWGEIGYDPYTMVCIFVRGPENKSYNTFVITSSVVIPLSSISFCYLQILRKICTNHKKVALMRNNEQPQPQQQRKQKISQTMMQREDLRYTRMMACIFIAFFISYCPYYINLLIDPDCENLSVDAGTAMCQWLSNFLHPIIYVAMNQHFRKAFVTLWPLSGRGSNTEPSNLPPSIDPSSTL